MSAKRIWLTVGPLALALATTSAASTAVSKSVSHPWLWAPLAVVSGLAFCTSGLIAWTRRPENGTGRLLVAVGLAFLGLSSLWNANAPWLASLGTAFGAMYLPVFLHLLVAYPQGRLRTPVERGFVASVYAIAFLATVLPQLFDRKLDCDTGACPRNLFLVSDRPHVAHVLEDVGAVLGVVIFLGLFVALLRRWRSASPAARRQLSPVYLAGTAVLVLIAIGFGTSFASSIASEVAWITGLAAFIALPFLFLGGLLRGRLARITAARLLLQTPDEPSLEEVQASLRRALRDPTLELLEWADDEGSYVDAAGERHRELTEHDGRATTRIDYAGRPLAAIVHDAVLREEPELLDEVVAAGRLALEKDRGHRALRRSEARMRALVDAMPDLMIRFRRDGTYLDIRGNTSGLVAPPEEMIGRSVWDLLPTAVVGPLMQCAYRALDSGLTETVEYELELADGKHEFEARMVPSGSDEIVSIVRDITEQRLLEAELQERLAEIEREQEFTRTVVNVAPAIFVLVDPEGRIIRFNDTCRRLLGYEDDEATHGRFLWDVFVAPESGDAARLLLDRLAAGEGPVERELVWRSRGGASCIVHTSGTTIYDGRGQLRFLFCGLDITESKGQEEELRRSRARIVEAGDAERRRLERNLHDGAQQRLVSLSLALRLAQARLRTDAGAASDILTRAGEELGLALEELRELARGIHPAVLTDRGLGAALEGLAARASVPVELNAIPSERLPAAVEAAAFYVVSESLTNVAKYAQASRARVSVMRENGRALVEVADDGVGGADPSRGSGLRGLADRIEALDGLLVVESVPGSGTRIRAEIPCL